MYFVNFVLRAQTSNYLKESHWKKVVLIIKNGLALGLKRLMRDVVLPAQLVICCSECLESPLEFRKVRDGLFPSKKLSALLERLLKVLTDS